MPLETAEGFGALCIELAGPPKRLKPLEVTGAGFEGEEAFAGADLSAAFTGAGAVLGTDGLGFPAVDEEPVGTALAGAVLGAGPPKRLKPLEVTGAGFEGEAAFAGVDLSAAFTEAGAVLGTDGLGFPAVDEEPVVTALAGAVLGAGPPKRLKPLEVTGAGFEGEAAFAGADLSAAFTEAGAVLGTDGLGFPAVDEEPVGTALAGAVLGAGPLKRLKPLEVTAAGFGVKVTFTVAAVAFV